MRISPGCIQYAGWVHLKTLTLRGFKSFASATTLQFEPGITCVVGPNGSGKSNVVDALAWVMGEQGAKTLRGGAMADVIFAGTADRPPLGRAEVSLTIDNSDGALPIEYSEVTITRTLFRNGGSEYAINGASCRLLDIQELLSDSGLGREMHVIVGQGRLDSVLTATPEERRGFIEEAAGILKHRRRKEKALRKLDSMAANLARLTDLTGEIRRQLGPLAKQADVARRAGVIQTELRDATARLLADDVVQLTTTLASELADETAIRRSIAEVTEHLGEVTGQLEALETEASQAAPHLAEVTEMWYRLSSLKERLRGTATVAAERHRHVSEAANVQETVGRDPEELTAQAVALRQSEAELRLETDGAQLTLQQATEARLEAERQSAQAERQLATIHQAIADRREGLARLSGQVAAGESRLQAATREQERLRETLDDARQRAEAAATARSDSEAELVLREQSDGDHDGQLVAGSAELEQARVRFAEVSEARREAREQLAHWQARQEALSLSLQARDATAPLRERGLDIGALVAESIKTPPTYAAAVSAAFSDLAEAVLVADHAAALTALEVARQADLGTARLVVRTPLGAGHDHGDGVAPVGTWLLDLVELDADASPALQSLLADVVVVETLAQAQTAAAQGLRGVTLDGDLVTNSYVIGGSSAGATLVQLQAALDEATAGHQQASATLADREAELEPVRRAVNEKQDQLTELESARERSRSELSALGKQVAQYSATHVAAVAEAERSELALERLAGQLESTQSELDTLRARLEAAQTEPSQAADDLEHSQAQRDACAETARVARGSETDARLVLRTLEERGRALAGRAESLERAAATERRAREVARVRREKLLHQAMVAARVRDDATTALVVLEESLSLAATQREQAEAQRTERDKAITALRTRIQELDTRQRELTDVVHRDEVARAEQRLRIEQLHDRAMAELGLDAQTLIDEYGPHLPIPPVRPHDSAEEDELGEPVPYARAEQERRLKAAQRGLSLLGKVNPLALEEHAALAERHQFLSEQLADLKKSRTDLLHIVKEIDERVERVFSEAYADTAQKFIQVFQVLFPGGEGRLVLTDPDDMLTTGIEIEARPPGKKVKRLSLLSGGERSLTAIALLVSIFKARPSPFYVMDEVEAALDDVNLGRLLAILTELRADSQLIVITHQKRTMEIADALYGVSMRGDGVTTVISQRIQEQF